MSYTYTLAITVGTFQRDRSHPRMCIEAAAMGPVHRGHPFACNSALVYTSVIVFGTVEIVEDRNQRPGSSTENSRPSSVRPTTKRSHGFDGRRQPATCGDSRDDFCNRRWAAAGDYEVGRGLQRRAAPLDRRTDF